MFTPDDLKECPVRYAPMHIRIPIDNGKQGVPFYIAARCYVISSDPHGCPHDDFGTVPAYKVYFPLIARRAYQDRDFRSECNNRNDTQTTYCLYKDFSQAAAVARELSKAAIDGYLLIDDRAALDYCSTQLLRLEEQIEEYNESSGMAIRD